MDIKITGIDNLKRTLNKTAAQLNTAIAKGINDTGFGLRLELVKEIKDSFDRPTPLVQNSILYEKATSNKLSGKIYVNDALINGQGGAKLNIAAILRPHVTGEDRIVKNSEKRLRRFGFMGYDQYIVPGPYVPLDLYGNISGQTMVRILSQIDAFSEGGYKANAKIKKANSRRTINYLGSMFVIPRVGIFMRIGWRSKTDSLKHSPDVRDISIKPLIFFVSKPRYSSRFNFYGISRQYITQNVAKNIKWNLASLLRS